MRHIERKLDTREKIKLGGLVKKAGLDGLPTATLYGLLLDAAEKLASESGDQHKQDWNIKGDLSLTFDD